MRNRMIVAASLIACVLAVVLGVVVATPSDDRPALLQGRKGAKAKSKGKSAARRASARERRDERREVRADKRAAKAERRAELAELRKKRKDKKQRDKPSPEEKALARAEARAIQLDELLAQHDAVSADLGIDVDVADELAILMMDTSDKVGEQLERIDLGEVEFEDVRDDIRAMRQDQVDTAEDLLGPDLFAEWTYLMGFRRFNEEDITREPTPRDDQ